MAQHLKELGYGRVPIPSLACTFHEGEISLQNSRCVVLLSWTNLVFMKKNYNIEIYINTFSSLINITTFISGLHEIKLHSFLLLRSA